MESADSRGDHRELVAACKDEARLYPTQELRGRQWAQAEQCNDCHRSVLVSAFVSECGMGKK
jgi:cbb3-type cytochrome oxidase cytochrome c subunit